MTAVKTITKCEQGRDMKGRGHAWSVSAHSLCIWLE
jgi:hypothetical protein